MARSAAAIETATWSLIHALLPEVLIFGGGIGERHYTLYREAAERAIAGATFAPEGAIRVVRAVLGNDAGMVGAAALMLDPRVNRAPTRKLVRDAQAQGNPLPRQVHGHLAL